MRIEKVAKVILEEEEKRMLVGTKRVLAAICGQLSCCECPLQCVGEPGEDCVADLLPEVVKALDIKEDNNE